jgi:hypothetical protein
MGRMINWRRRKSNRSGSRSNVLPLETKKAALDIEDLNQLPITHVEPPLNFAEAKEDEATVTSAREKAKNDAVVLGREGTLGEMSHDTSIDAMGDEKVYDDQAPEMSRGGEAPHMLDDDSEEDDAAVEADGEEVETNEPQPNKGPIPKLLEDSKRKYDDFYPGSISTKKRAKTSAAR